MARGVLRVRIVGDERELTSSLKRAHTEVGKFSGGVSGALKGLALLGGGAALVGGFKKAIDQTVQWGSEVKSLSRNLGISSQQASGLALAAEHYGLGVDNLSKGLGIFEKHIVAGDKAAQSLGITFKDNKGQLLPFNTILEKTSAVFQKLPDGPQKTALALNLFGRSGKELIPFLNAGPKAMREFSDEAKRLGLSLSGDNLRTIANYKFATRDFTASLHGLEVQIGLRVLPVLTTFAHIAAAGVELLGKIPTPVLGAAAAFGIFVGAVSLASRFAGAAQEVFGSLGSGLRDIFGGSEQASAGLRAQSAAATQGIAANTAAATAAGRLTLANDALAGATDQSSLATEIARVQTLKDATAQTIATAAAARATAAAEAQAAANITVGESALAAAIGLQREALAATEASAAYTGGGLRGALAGIAGGLGSIISKVGPASIALGAVGGFLYFTARAAHAAANEAETFANAFAAAAGTGPAGIQKIKDEIGSLQLELNKAERLTGGRNLLQALTFWKPSDKDRLKNQIKDLKNILKELGIQADAAGDAGATALSKIDDSLDATGKFQDNLKRLVAEGVPLQVANQLKTMGQDGIDAAQQLADGVGEAGDKARATFINLAEQTLPVVEKKLAQFAGMTRTDFRAWAAGLTASLNFVESGLSSIASSLSDTTVSKALTSASRAVASATDSEAAAKTRLAEFEARFHDGRKKTAADLIRETDLQNKLSAAQGKASGAASDLASAQRRYASSSDQLLKSFSDTLKAQQDYAANFETLLRRNLPADFAKQLLDAGQSGASVVQALATANDKQFKAIIAKWESAQFSARQLHRDIVIFADLSPALRSIVSAVDAQVGAFTRSAGASSKDSAAKRTLLGNLRDLEVKYPVLKGLLQGYIDKINHTPKDHTTRMHLNTPSKAQVEKAAQNLINHFDTKFDKAGGIPLTVTPQFGTTDMHVDATNVYLSGHASAEGRIVTSPMFSLIGEAGPEAVIPLSFGKKARRDQLLRESGLMKEILSNYGVKLADGAVVSGRSGGSIPASLYSVSAVRAPSPSVSSVTYDDHSTVIVNNPVPEKLSETLPALRRRKQLLRGY